MEAVVRELQSDAQLGVFLSPDCNVSAIASSVVARDSASRDVSGNSRLRSSSSTSFTLTEDLDESSQSEQFVERLDGAVKRIDRVISEHIGEHHATLLDQVGSVDELQDHVTSVQSSVGQLKQSVHSLHALVREQHENLRDTIQRYRNVEQCGDIVRRVLRFQQLSDRVLGQNEMASVALAIREMELLVQDENFEELSAVRAKLPATRKLSANLKREVRAALRSGIQNLSQADVGDALQILLYLGDLATTAQASVNDVIREVERKCSAAIAEEKLVRSGSCGSNGLDTSNGASGSIVQKSDVWKALQDVFDVIRVHAMQVWNLQRVLLKMVDPTSGQKYLDLVLEPDEPSLFATFWEVTCALVRELFASTLGYSTAVKSVLIAEYPRMREQATRVLHELFASTKQSAELTPIAGCPAERTQLLDSMAPLYDAFIERAYRRMSNPIQLMFPQSSNFHASPPGRSDMQTLSRTIFSELEHAGQDPVLLDGTLQQVRKAVSLFCSNVKRIMYQGKAAASTMPSFARTPAQAHNVGLMNVLSLLDDAVEEIVNRTETAAAHNGTQTGAATNVPSAADTVATGVVSSKEAKALCTKILIPCREMIGDLKFALLGFYLQALAALLENIFAKMHEESFGDQSAAARVATSGDAPRSSGGVRPSQGLSGSKYMQEFCNTFAIILDEHLRRLPVAVFATKCLEDFVERLISVFIRHASLLRPLTENGKLRLADDMAQLELRLEHIVPLRNVGAVYEELRAFRHMIFLGNSEILRDPTIDRIRPSNVWHHLTSRAPPELQLPHQMKHWTASKYIEWLDTRAVIGQPSSPSTTPPSSSGKSSASSPSWKELPLGYPCWKFRRLGLQAEKQAWKEITKCLDAYSQRVSASANAELSPIYDLLQESSAILLAGYEMMISR
ncbi:conserved oligomeric Golgi complex subunit 5, putative [Phytophthora infestans T30-4]|uniref:Conserved oligomeric Golgi complex subunit 5 n=1 Tax=Phytophthora infestans (strain T30-4) TaxID=403677 RepID=D0MTN6_PHYIT|nr:conserved oligomeric Golgi complex subunit 5, putative [Phytophthora infestans T30-4]EEY61333.1 conserved oligomeric Golgi complex subunit 5, putative [Phytophthora infestans T30-4]|eukprot:XP_002908250.1 conserved oligomeric Golgi complex subunit 5, putative [Phytophthora infestans T30-4]